LGGEAIVFWFMWWLVLVMWWLRWFMW